jgi:hypothetical protein
MAEDDLEYCRNRIAEETFRAQAAPYPEVAEKHLQMVMLYRTQLAALARAVRAEKERTATFMRAA